MIRRALDEVPETLDGTCERTLLGIEKEKREISHRIFQCLTVSARPLRVDELAEILAIRFDAGQFPQYDTDLRPKDAQESVLSVCSSLIRPIGQRGKAPFPIPCPSPACAYYSRAGFSQRPPTPWRWRRQGQHWQFSICLLCCAVFGRPRPIRECFFAFPGRHGTAV